MKEMDENDPWGEEKKIIEKIVSIDLEIHKDASADEWERYDASLTTITYQLFKNEIGTWGGRETCMTEPEDGFMRSNYWYVLESGISKAEEEIKRIIDNFNLKDFTNLKISRPIDTATDYKTMFETKSTLNWSWTK